MRHWLLASVSVLFPMAAWGQSAPNWPTGYRPSSSELNAAFAGKQDIGIGFTNPILNNPTITGGSITGTTIDLSTPGPIGVVTPNTGAFTTLTIGGVPITGGSFLPVAGGTLSGPGNLTVSGTLGVTGAATLASTLGVTGAATVGGTLGVTGVSTLASTTVPRLNSSPTAAQLQINAALGSGIDGPAIDWIYSRVRWFGVVQTPDASSDGQISPNHFIYTDAADIRGTSASASAILAMTVVEGNTGAFNNAQRTAVNSHLVVTGQVGATPIAGQLVDAQQFVSALSYARASVSQGGLGGWSFGQDPSLGQFRGSLFGGNDLALLNTGATNWQIIMGREIDVAIAGGTVLTRVGLLISAFPSTSQGQGDDGGLIIITNDNTTNNFKNGIQFGGIGAFAKVTDSLLKTSSRSQPAGLAATLTVPRGIDFSDAVFTDAFLRGPSNTFVVDGSGNVTGASYKVGATAGVSCTVGTLNPVTAVVTFGIVTHC